MPRADRILMSLIALPFTKPAAVTSHFATTLNILGPILPVALYALHSSQITPTSTAMMP